MNNIILNNGVEMPQLGFGTFLIPKENFERAICEAYDMGYRQFDTAWRYHNEVDLVRALKNHHVNREDVFITTKVNADALYKHPYYYGWKMILNIPTTSIKEAVEESFENLKWGGNDYIDLFLVHAAWPMYMKMYKVLDDFYKQGRIRAIGTSNFLPPHIESLKEITDTIPAVNQFEISPLNTQKKLIKYCQDKGIAAQAMSTFSHFRSVEPRMEIIENPIIKEIAKKHEKSTVQIVLRWLLQQNVILIPKTWEVEHMKENISIFDFSLDNEEMGKIDSLDHGKFLNYNPYELVRFGMPRKYRKWEGFNDASNYSEYHNNRPWYKKMLFNLVNQL
jgi:diketogulonate reductase-like aldo/keto reductase